MQISSALQFRASAPSAPVWCRARSSLAYACVLASRRWASIVSGAWPRRRARQPGADSRPRHPRYVRRAQACTGQLDDELSVSFLPLVFAAVVFGPLAAMASVPSLSSADFRRPYMRWTIWTLERSHDVGAIAGLAALMACNASVGRFSAGYSRCERRGSCGRTGGRRHPQAACSCAQRHRVVRRASVGRWRPLLAATVPLYTPIIAVLAYAYATFRPGLSPSSSSQQLQHSDYSSCIASSGRQRSSSRWRTSNSSGPVFRSRSHWSPHSMPAIATPPAIQRPSRSIHATSLAHGLQRGAAAACATSAGLVHDIGKIGLPPGLLEKPGPLTLDERRVMEQHSEIGERILRQVENYSRNRTIVRHHHERVDGHGYPDGLLGDEIPLLSRIIAVADAYNAMTSDRPYRDAMPSRVARLRLAQAVESQFDTSVVAAFEAILAGADERYRSGLELKLRLSGSPAAAPPRASRWLKPPRPAVRRPAMPLEFLCARRASQECVVRAPSRSSR